MKKSVTITNIDVKSVAKISGFIGVIIGIFVGATYGYVFGSLYNLRLGLGIFALGPVAYGIFLYVFGAFGAIMYNLASKKIGGVKIETR